MLLLHSAAHLLKVWLSNPSAVNLAVWNVCTAVFTSAGRDLPSSVWGDKCKSFHDLIKRLGHYSNVSGCIIWQLYVKSSIFMIMCRKGEKVRSSRVMDCLPMSCRSLLKWPLSPWPVAAYKFSIDYTAQKSLHYWQALIKARHQLTGVCGKLGGEITLSTYFIKMYDCVWFFKCAHGR